MLGRHVEPPNDVAVAYLDVAAAAGAGRIGASERERRREPLPRALLMRLGIAAAEASIIDVAGDSMAPTFLDGDRLLIDRATTRVPTKGGVFVIREEDVLSVKRVSPDHDMLRIASDNPAYPPRRVALAAATIVGRARLLLREI